MLSRLAKAYIGGVTPSRGVPETYRWRGLTASTGADIVAAVGSRKLATGALILAALMVAAPGRPFAAWVTDESGCEIWLDNDAATSVNWDGGCRAGRVEGPGRLTVIRGVSGRSDRVEMRCDCVASGGRVTGEGTIVGPDYGRFEGGLVNGAPHGAGIRLYKSGERHQGAWRSGKREGPGEVISPRGWRYRGGFVADEFSGQGRSEWRNGDWHEGAYLAGMRHGHGAYGSKTGGWRYHGAFVKGVREGPGLLVLETGHTFSGVFKKGKPDGKGVCRDPTTKNEGACRYSLGRFMEWLE